MTAPADDPRSGEAKHAGIVREATDLCWKATPFNEDTTGAITDYLLPAGVVHRLLGQLQGAGYPAAFRASTPPAAGRGDTDSGGATCGDLSPALPGWTAQDARELTCELPVGHAGAHQHDNGDGLPPTRWIARPAGDRAQPTQELREAISRTVRETTWVTFRAGDGHLSTAQADEGDVADEILALPAVAALLDAQAAVNRVEALHTRDGNWCNGCDSGWPCPTSRALDGTT